MNRGLIVKAIRETWWSSLLLGLGLSAVEAVLAYVLPTFQKELAEGWQTFTFLQPIIKALLGADVASGIGPEMFTSIAWVHPVVLAIVWAHAILFCTRVPAGEVDRGTIDVLLGLPVSRMQLLVSETAVWLVSGAAVLAMGVAGNVLGGINAGVGVRPDPVPLAIVIVNLLCLYVAVGGLAWLASSMSQRRGRAIGVVFAIVLASFLLNYLAQFWDLAKTLSFLSVLEYYRPLVVFRSGAWPVRDLLILGAVGAGLWSAAGVIFSRRDLTTA